MADAKKPAKPKLTAAEKREQDYQQARSMENWIQWAVGYQDRAQLCEQAAAAYEKLGDYQDAPERRGACLARREQALTVERDQAFEQVRQELKEAKTAQDYYYAAQKLERFPDLPAAEKLLESVRKRRRALLRRRSLLRRTLAAGIALLLTAAAVLFHYHVPQYLLGRIYFETGSYGKALRWFNASGDFLNARKRAKLCRYEQGRSLQQEGKYQAAYKKFRELENYQDAPRRSLECIHALLAQAKPGDIVRFGRMEDDFPQWIVLANDAGQVTLLAEFSEGMKFDPECREWPDCQAYEWLNTTFLPLCFTEQEQALLVNPTGEGDGPVYLLSRDEVEQYEDILKAKVDEDTWADPFQIPTYGYWLRTPSYNQKGQMVVQSWHGVDTYGSYRNQGRPHVRPVITVSVTS